MKKLKIFGSLSLLLLLMAGCKKDYLENMSNFNTYDESIFTNETETGWYIDNIYYNFYSAYKSPLLSVVGSYTDTRTRMTEEIGSGTSMPDQINPQKTLVNATDADGYYGSNLSSSVSNNPYTRIRNCNSLLQKIDQVGQSLSATFRTRAKGQMYFFRALQYFDLVRVYGGVPLVTTVQNASATDESIKLPRAKSSEVFAQIVSDLDSAAILLPITWDAANYGRVSGAAAMAMKSRVLLTAASPLFNTDWDNAASDKWQKALKAGLDAETALTAAGYGLYGASAKDWSEMWWKVDNAFNKEAIMAQLLSSSTAASGVNNNGWEKSIRLTKQTGSGGISAPKEMIDLFPMADGSRPKPGVNYDSTLFFLNRDPRFYRTFAFSGMRWNNKDSATYSNIVWLYRWIYTGNKVAYSDGNSFSSPAVVRKMSNPNASPTTGFAFSGTDIMEYRYAELLLNIAECYAATGNVGQCVNYLGKIRARVGIPSTNNYGIGTPASKYAAIEACLYERRVELAYEGKRFWDLQRWMLYSDDASLNDNTNALLGVAPLNGTTHTGRLWQYKNVAPSATDPLTAARGSIAVDPDASDFTTQLNNLKTFYQNNLVTVPTDTPMDKDASGAQQNILFRSNYYVSGLSSTVLSYNPWLQQTIGWNDYSGAPGTYNYRQ